MKRLIKSLLITILLAPVMASAHTIAVGASNAGAPGSVTVWLGSYGHSPAPGLEGSITLNGVTKAFDQLVNALPTGLILGNNYFFADAHGSGNWGNLASNSFTSTSNLVGLGSVVAWQGATFTGLAVGTYGYDITGMASQWWNNINSFAANWSGSVVISQASVSTPEPAMLALLGLGLAGLGFSRRRAKA